jgi:glycerol kinase
MKYVVALDQGTTSSRAIVYDENARVVSSAQKEFTQFYPQPGYVEHDPLEIYSSQSEELAMSAVDNGGVYIVPAFTGQCTQET